MKKLDDGRHQFALREDLCGAPFVDVPVSCIANAGVVRLAMGEIVKSGCRVEIATVIRLAMTMQTARELAKVLTDIVDAQTVRVGNAN